MRKFLLAIGAWLLSTRNQRYFIPCSFYLRFMEGREVNGVPQKKLNR